MARSRSKKNKPIVRPGDTPAPVASATSTSGVPFADFDLNRLKKILTRAEIPEYSINKLFIEGDHWQDGEGWVGPNVEDDSKVKEELQKAFVSKNVIKEIAERHAAGVLGRSPVWNVAPRVPDQNADPKKPKDAVIVEAELALTDWWDSRKVHKKLREACANLQWGARAPFRLFVPPGRVVTGAGGAAGLPVATDLAMALDYIFPDVPDADKATVYVDPDTEQQLGIFVNRPIDQKTGDPGSKDVAELSYLDPASAGAQGKPLTVLKIFGGDNDNEVQLDLGGRILMFEAERALLITEQLQEQQRALNCALSMLPRNVVSGGFLERILTNTQLPGEWKLDDKGNKIKFIPDEFEVGAGTTNVIQGIEVEQEDGKVDVKEPGVHFRDPTPVKPSIEAATALYLVMLEEGKQAHIILSGEALVSGNSREQARSDYDLSLTESQDTMEMMGQWVLETALALAEQFMNTPGKYTSKYKVAFQAHTFTGPVTWEERKQNDDSIGKTLSQARAMELNGTVDVDAEQNRMRSEQTTRLGYIQEQGTAMKALTDAGMTPEIAAETVGFAPAIVSAIKTANEAALQQDQANLKAQLDAKTKTGPPATKPKPKKGAGGG